MAEIQTALELLFCPPLDTALVAAIAHEPGQTLQSAKELCEVLAAAAIPDSPSPRQPPSPPPSSTANVTHNTDTPGNGPASTSRRKNFGGKLTKDGSEALGSGPKGIGRSNSAYVYPSPLLSSPSSSASFSRSDTASVERLLDEWKLIGLSSGDPDNLRLTDDESEVASHAYLDGIHGLAQSQNEGETARIGEASGRGLLGLPANDRESSESLSASDVFNPLLFLQHAFPSRTQSFLEEMLQSSNGDVQEAVDTLIAIELVESEDAREEELSHLKHLYPGQERNHLLKEKTKGLDYEELSHGSSSGLVGKKKRAARKKVQGEERKALGLAGQSLGRKEKEGRRKMNLTDVRHGAPIRFNPSKPSSIPISQSGIKTGPLGLTDAELAALLDAEEKRLNKDPDDNEPVRDNAWLLTSSVLAQLSTLLEMESTKVNAAYNSSSFNLQIATARLIEIAAAAFPTLESLDEAGDAPAGTARRMVETISTISEVGLSKAEKAFRATKGKQDHTIDLLQLQEVVKAAAPGSTPDELDPLGRLKHVGDAEIVDDTVRNAELESVRGYSVEVGPTEGRFKKGQDYYPTPSQSTGHQSPSSDELRSNKYSRAAAKVAPNPVTGAMEALRNGATGTVLPASSSQVVDPATGLGLISEAQAKSLGIAPHKVSYDPSRRMVECRMVAEDYRQRRDEALRKAAQAWRSGKGGAGRKNGDLGRGGVAWHYADEARRLDAKARAWSLRASQALVEDRRNASVGVMRSVGASDPNSSSSSRAGPSSWGSSSYRGDTIDLHGVTVHEALTIVRENVTQWYSRPGSKSIAPFKIITGVGRHSPHQIAVLKPAVAKMLEREGWRIEVDHHRGIITVRGVK
ncbi:hypothetical protein IE53DRAFT_319303 [Violaceomyces palustris]|uniref:Uncharacterized protein n=1 Tax=Violaceomyces palustris TaxID=1673888 RepID=A0ACD0NRM4_9BASI|nr:hypothetical protein IE53DRAFT_319303 [Violaceomyces palustris]